jgi:hypothetical protein
MSKTILEECEVGFGQETVLNVDKHQKKTMGGFFHNTTRKSTNKNFVYDYDLCCKGPQSLLVILLL